LLADGLLRYYHRLRTISDADSFSGGRVWPLRQLNLSPLNKQIAAGGAAVDPYRDGGQVSERHHRGGRTNQRYRLRVNPGELLTC